jgi:hypothetical protein
VDRRASCRVLVGKPEENRPLGRPRPRWMDNIKMDIPEIRRGGMDLFDLSQDRDACWYVVSAVFNIWVP